MNADRIGFNVRYQTVRRVFVTYRRSERTKIRVLDWLGRNGYRVTAMGPSRRDPDCSKVTAEKRIDSC
jgi:hypothetical protein